MLSGLPELLVIRSKLARLKVPSRLIWLPALAVMAVVVRQLVVLPSRLSVLPLRFSVPLTVVLPLLTKLPLPSVIVAPLDTTRVPVVSLVNGKPYSVMVRPAVAAETVPWLVMAPLP